jgi:hypothetical protein
MRENKYLLRKRSGSRSHLKINWKDYDRSEHIGNFLNEDIEDKFPKKESMLTKNKNGIDTGLIKRWLNSKIGKGFDSIYSEFLDRIQPKYKEEYKDSIFNYAIKPNLVIINNGKVYQKEPYTQSIREVKGYYFHPITKILYKV